MNLIRLGTRGKQVELEKLLNKGTDLNFFDQSGLTPLMLASEKSDYDTVKLLLDHGAEVNLTAINGSTALNRAIKGLNVDNIDLLLDRGAQVNMSANGWTPILEAAQAGNPTIIKMLIEKGADLKAKTFSGDTAFSLSLKNRSFDIALNLYKRNLDDTITDKKMKVSLLTQAANEQDLATMKKLASSNLDLNIQDYAGRLPLVEAAFKGPAENVQFLLNNGARINTKSLAGWAPLHAAALGGRLGSPNF